MPRPDLDLVRSMETIEESTRLIERANESLSLALDRLEARLGIKTESPPKPHLHVLEGGGDDA
jgi:hypothetical protein